MRDCKEEQPLADPCFNYRKSDVASKQITPTTAKSILTLPYLTGSYGPNAHPQIDA